MLETGTHRRTGMTLSTLFSLQPGTAGRARLVYVGLLAGLLLPGLNVAAAVLAWQGREQGDEMIRSHTRNQLHIFCKSVVYVLIGLVLTYFLFGVLLIMATIIWYILRILRGLTALAANQPAANPESWLL